ncbi:MAG: UDP-N-acetylmuramoyl-L-alanine--D-glutamate ligase [Ruminococcaceae bacterium]|nr:UDP-N-acetylmuramoyl-L-alanine--D-glutamate ligase [Oscillospiraceae bacterium]
MKNINILEGLSGKHICVLGMGISNFPLIRYLYKKGAKNIFVIDKSDSPETIARAESLKSEGIEFRTCFGENYLNVLKTEKFDIIFKTPVVRYDVPELAKAVEKGAVLTSEMEVFLNLCPGKIFAVTGSDGKTTTTTLIYKFLNAYCEKNGGKAWVGGNIGTPLLQFVDEMTENDFVVVELSSFQLMKMKAQTDVAVITNITPNHLDVHKSYEEYIDAKKNIFLNNGTDSITVLNLDNEVTASMNAIVPGKLYNFSRKDKVKKGVWLEGDQIMSHNGKIMDRGDIILPGNHNVENYMTAIAATMDIVPTEIMREIANAFGGVEHRLEFVRELDGVKYYNSSIDSSPNRTLNALSVFGGNVVLMAGGKDKNIPYDDLGPALADKVKAMVLTGPTAEKIEKALKDELGKRGLECEIPVIYAKSYQEAVENTRNLAKKGDVVLLSPASTSFDMFKNFEERGNLFKKLVLQLK